MTQFIIAYEVEGATYTCKVDATTFADAQRHLLALASTGRVSGEHVMDVPAQKPVVFEAYEAQQALEALETSVWYMSAVPKNLDAVIAALRTALMSAPDGSEQPADQEPVWIQPNHLQHARREPFLCRVEPTHRDDFIALYPEAPQPVKREPLTDFDIADRFYAIGGSGANCLRYFAAGVRYAEADHGIGGGK